MKPPPLAGARPRTLTGLFLIVVGLPAIALVWLGAQLLLQDRSVAMQRESEQRHADLQGAARALEKLVEGAAQRLPEGAARYKISASAISVEPAGSVLWQPNMPKLPAAPDPPFAEMERVEFQGGAARARVFYEQQTASMNPAVRAGAWLRAARVHWREQGWADALRAYGRLAAITSVSIDGLPADFVARRARCDVLREAGRMSELVREAEAVRSDILANRWALDRGSWERAAAQVTEWTGRAMDVPESRRTFSEMGIWLWEHRAGRPEKVVVANNHPVTLIWSTGSVIAVPPDLVEQWLRQATTQASSLVSVLTESGLHVAGPRHVSGRSLTASAAETGLPWVLVASPKPGSAGSPELAARRRLLAFGLATIVLLVAGAGYLLWRVVHRELAVARLQTDFVAAVSHEFRTPLASLRHVTELHELFW